jgi:hypothetical protein
MQTDTVMHIKHFVRVNRITMTATQVDSNPNMDPTAPGSMDHWKVTFTRTYETETEYHDRETAKTSRRTYTAKMTTYFSMGFGHHGKAPESADVLDCLASDADSVTGIDFECWCGNFGYDPDSRKAEKIYKACEHGAARLRKFLGDDLYQVLLYQTERL